MVVCSFSLEHPTCVWKRKSMPCWKIATPLAVVRFSSLGDWQSWTEMIERYGKGTHALCTECRRKIFITEAQVTVQDGKRLVKLKCKNIGCTAYYKPTLCDENNLEIRGTAG